MILFIAIDAHEINFDPDLALKKLKTNLKMKELEFRWVPQKNYHISMNFLGQVESQQLPILKSLLGE
jgi:2'-5' RNA ligase